MTKKRKKKKKNIMQRSELPVFQWMDDNGLHIAAPGTTPAPEELQKMTKEYQEQIRKSPIWDMMVKEFGEEKAEEMLREFQVKIE